MRRAVLESGCLLYHIRDGHGSGSRRTYRHALGGDRFAMLSTAERNAPVDIRLGVVSAAEEGLDACYERTRLSACSSQQV